ncbi:hypothetical protein Hoch_6260 [Haliangium ochraceum DSM 14365]|uniref:Lipoprotein n=1 Tax=Haliangium ochraceum (strain DSM 14365 / JCM 11303 / SMP-2) TaxID=502025 RepID=D0LMP4_HALO1|nr:hypothetical protein Hoch_6260 [Haliangium ochraceum DSM 14365]
MFARLYLIPLSLSLALGSACGDNTLLSVDDPDAANGDASPVEDARPILDARPAFDAQPIDAPPIDANTWRAIMRDPNEPMARRIEAALAGVDLDTCFLSGGDTSACDWEMFRSDATHVEAGYQQKEAVLIIDVLAPAVEILRYRNRVLGFYEVRDDGTLGSVPLEWELPETFGDIVTGFANSPAIPSDALAELLPRLQEVYSADVPGFSSHGLAVFNILADLISDNPIVFLDNNLMTFHQAIPEVVCAVEDVEDVAPLRAHAETIAQQLEALFAIHNIHFVNASWGFTIETVRGPWTRVCGTPVPSTEILLEILDAYRPIFEVLFDTEGVFTAHASLASPVDEHYPFDQDSPEFPNRLRVGVFQHPGAEIPAEGATGVPATWFPVPVDTADADVWVNVGCDYFVGCRDERPLSLNLQYGMGRANFPLAQSSFNNPLLLATFVFFRNQLSMEAMDDTLIQDLIDMLIPECAFGMSSYCRYIDPLLHRQMDGYHGPLPIGGNPPGGDPPGI